jgi:peroxiredoxin
MIVPHMAWNYSHNRNFLAYAQSMLGLPTAALQGAYDLLNAPVDPKYNQADEGDSTFREGLSALRRTLVRFERWDDLLEPGRVPWQDTPEDRMWRTYATALAWIGRGKLDAAEKEALSLRGMVDDFDPEEDPGDEWARARTPYRLLAVMRAEVDGRLWLARGDSVRGLRSLGEAAELELAMRGVVNDPPVYPRGLYNVLGEAYLELGSPRPAVGAFERALEVQRNNGFSWAGLTRAHHMLGELDEARRAYARMLHVWSGAEAGIWQNEKARALGLEAEPRDDSPAPQHDYPGDTLARLGPNLWQPYDAPELVATASDGSVVTLADYRGKNVLLVFYLSDQCVHCVEQLHAIRERIGAFAQRDTAVLAISADTPEKNAASKVGSLPFTVLSDTPDHDNAIRFKSFDEFEEIELHSTQIIDKAGRLRWVRSGGDPFMDIEFLLRELDRIEEIEAKARLATVGMDRTKTDGQR